MQHDKQMSPKGWQKVMGQHLRDLTWLRKMLMQEMRYLKKAIADMRQYPDEQTDKRSAAAMAELLRISQVHMKAMAEEKTLLLEREGGGSRTQIAPHSRITDEDWAILGAALERRVDLAKGQENGENV